MIGDGFDTMGLYFIHNNYEHGLPMEQVSYAICAYLCNAM